ncbi:M50 family metallopeptidase [Candidatus Palauibacter sp.]|uniref:M50 family metallopeptidase n=1 Tax=Candidatus Palauibacter sp. TaxID=3101350 RepID=UPI003AF303E3
MTDRSMRRFRFLAAFGVLFLTVWFLWNTPFVYPVKLFVVLLHEISHGLATLATGGEIVAIEITPLEGGLCRCPGGNAFLTLSAGYLGSLLWGGLMIWGAERFPAFSSWLAAAVAVIVGTSTVLFVQQPFATTFGLAFAAALLAVAWRAGASVNRVVLTMLGLTSCLYAVLDIKSDILDRPELASDARMLAEMTGVPTLLWGGAWISVALLFCIFLFRWAWRRA